MADSDAQQRTEEAKAQCPFCRIIKGEIPARKVYEDEQIFAVLDINPKAKGHVLVLPKEHYPVLPLVPPAQQGALFSVVYRLSKAAAKATVNPYVNVYVANGGIAGQQVGHVMVHIIPQEHPGGFSIPEKEVSDQDLSAAELALSKLLPARMHALFSAEPSLRAPLLKTHERKQVEKQIQSPNSFSHLSKDEIVDALFANPRVLDVLIEKPQQFKEIVPKHPQLSEMFKDISVDEVIEFMKKRIAAKKSTFDPASLPSVVEQVMLTPLVRDAMLQDVGKFKEFVPQHEHLARLFSSVSVDDVYAEAKRRMRP